MPKFIFAKQMTQVLVFLFVIAVESGATVVDDHGQLSVSGNRLVDKNGATVVLRGMSYFWSLWGYENFWNASTVDWLADDWNVTVVRAAMGVENGGYLENATQQKNLVKTIVDAAIAKGIYVIVDWHDHNAASHTFQAQAFFSEMAQTYGNTPNIIYEIFNEPLAVSWTGTIKPYAQSVTSSIRTHDPDNIIVVGTPNWSQDVDDAAASPLPDANTAYALHFYAATHGSWLRSKATIALNSGIALFVTEWGTSEASGDGILGISETETWMNFMNSNNLSWCNWSVADKSETSSALKPGASTSGGWSLSQLSASGQLVRNYLLNLNGPGADPTDPVGKDTIALPGTLESENYNSMSGIELETTEDVGAGQNIGYIDNGDWVQYAVSFAATASYTVEFRVASAGLGGGIDIQLDGISVGSVDVAVTGGWQTWETVSVDVPLTVGSHSLRLVFSGESGGGLFNINKLTFSAEGVSSSFDFASVGVEKNDAVLVAEGLLMPMSAELSFRVFDMVGRIVFSQEKLSLSAGEHRWSDLLSGLERGSYFIQTGISTTDLRRGMRIYLP